MSKNIVTLTETENVIQFILSKYDTIKREILIVSADDQIYRNL